MFQCKNIISLRVYLYAFVHGPELNCSCLKVSHSHEICCPLISKDMKKTSCRFVLLAEWCWEVRLDCTQQDPLLDHENIKKKYWIEPFSQAPTGYQGFLPQG